MTDLARKFKPTLKTVIRPIPQLKPAATTGMYCRHLSPKRLRK